MNSDEILNKIKEIDINPFDSQEIKKEKYFKILNIIYGLKSQEQVLKEFAESVFNELPNCDFLGNGVEKENRKDEKHGEK